MGWSAACTRRAVYQGSGSYVDLVTFQETAFNKTDYFSTTTNLLRSALATVALNPSNNAVNVRHGLNMPSLWVQESRCNETTED